MNMKTMIQNALLCAIVFMAGTGYADNPTRPLGSTQYPLAVRFDFGKYDLKISPMAESQFAAMAQELRNYPFAKLEIEGYADAIGPEKVNQKLSDERASEVRKYFLQRYGLSPERVNVHAHGDKAPLASNATAEGRRQNRAAVARVYRLEPNTSGPTSHNL